MDLIFVHVEGTQEERPLEFDATTSKTVVYLRKNIERKTKTQDGMSYSVWEYDEAIAPMSEFSALVSQEICDIKPITLTQTAYYGESEKTFYNVPSGNVTVYFDNYNGSHSVSRISDRVTVSFDRLTEQTNIILNIN